MSTRRLLPRLFTTFREPEDASAQLYIIEAFSWLTTSWGYESLRAGRDSHARHSYPRAGGGAGRLALRRDGANRAAAARLSHRQDRPARRRRRADGTGHRAVPQGAQLRPGGTQGRAVRRRHWRQPGAGENQDP